MFRPPHTAVCRGGTSQGMMVGLWSPCSWAPQIPLISPFFQWTNFSEVYFQMLLSSPPQLVTGFFSLFTCLPGQHDSMRCVKTKNIMTNQQSLLHNYWALKPLACWGQCGFEMCTDKSHLPEHLPYLRTSKGELLSRDHGEDSQNSNCLHCCLIFVFTKTLVVPKIPKASVIWWDWKLRWNSEQLWLFRIGLQNNIGFYFCHFLVYFL